jgi:hypothetical protein
VPAASPTERGAPRRNNIGRGLGHREQDQRYNSVNPGGLADAGRSGVQCTKLHKKVAKNGSRNTVIIHG